MNVNTNEALLTAVEEYNFNNPKLYETDLLLDKASKDCTDIFFSFEYRCLFMILKL